MKSKTWFFFLVSLLAAGITPGFLFGKTLNLDYSTFLGGSGSDNGQGICVGMDGKAYIVGYTNSSDFPMENSYQAGYGGGSWDVFVSALSSTGSALVYSTYLGGNGTDKGNGISLGTDGTTHVTGYTDSSDFPTENPYQAGTGGFTDVFVSALSSTGALDYSTYFGGSGYEYGRGISLGTDGRVYVTGDTSSQYDFPMQNPYQAMYGGGANDVFVSALSSTGSALHYSTFLGGGDREFGHGISLGTVGVAYVTGYTYSSDFPTRNSYQAGHGGGDQDVFVSALSPTGTALSYSTYLGGNGPDLGLGISVGTDGRASVTGYTDSSDFPIRNPYQGGYGGDYDAFVSTLTSTGSALSYSTYLGGSSGDYGKGISVGTNGRAYVTGNTGSSDFPTENPYQASRYGSNDLFVTALASNGAGLYYSTYFGGRSVEYGYGISLGTDGAVYVTGDTGSSNFPTKNSYQAEYGGSEDAFVSKLILAGPPISPWIYDYNGDGTSDIAIFRGSSGLWAIRGITRVYFGGSTDETVPGDYNGDGTTEIGIFRATSGLWAIRSTTRAYFGGGSDLPEPGDYDGDETADIGIFRGTSGLWAIRGVTRVYFGGTEDLPASGYYDGYSKKEIGIFRGSSGLWAIRDVTRLYFGSSLDTIVPGDYDGDGTWETGIFRETSGLWAIRGVTRSYFGGGSDKPVPGIYKGNGTDNIGIFRENSGLWAIQGVSRVYFGTTGDLPVTR